MYDHVRADLQVQTFISHSQTVHIFFNVAI